jgi:YfiH family protein
MPTEASESYQLQTRGERQVGRFGPLGRITGVDHAVTTRQGGLLPADRDDPSAGELYREPAGLIGCRDAAWCRQIHGTTILRADQGGCAGEGDGLVTGRPGLALLCRSADCALILAADKSARCVGVAHASWRSTAGGIAGKLITAMHETFDVPRDSIVACVSPSAGPDRYEVGQDVYDVFVEQLGPDAKWFFTALNRRVAQPPSAEGMNRVGAACREEVSSEDRSTHPPGGKTYLLDLWSANSAALMAAGVGFMDIYTARVCTMERNDLYPSYRVEGESAGRFAGMIGLAG